MNYTEKILAFLDRQELIRTADLTELGIPRIYLSRMVAKGQLIKVSRGLYRKADSVLDEYHIFQLRYQATIYSYLSALYLHQLIDVIPKYLEVTVYSGYNANAFSDKVRVHYIKKDLHKLGQICVVTSFGNEVLTYDKERTICDLISNRSKLDVEIFSTALKRYMSSNSKNLTKLYRYAIKMGIEKKVREILEVLI